MAEADYVSEAEGDPREWTATHVRFTSQVHGKRGITWTAHLRQGPLSFERSATGEVRYGEKLRERATSEVVDDYLEYVGRQRT
jgi:hypothetical protein